MVAALVTVVSQYAGMIVAVLTAAFLTAKVPIVRKTGKWLWRTTVTDPARSLIHDTIDSVVQDRLEPVLRELRANGGESLRDAVNRIESKLDEHDEEIKTIVEEVAA